MRSRSRSPGALAATLALVLAATAPSARAQRVEPPVGAPPPSAAVEEPTAPAARVPSPYRSQPLRSKRWARPVASLLIPGSGQLLAGRSHGLAYVAAEVWLVSRAIAMQRQGRDKARSFRELAFDIARRSFTSVRRDGPWEYYEAMERFVESGAYDAGTGSSFTPEPDSTTFNGSVWALARRTFLANPDSLPAPDSPDYLHALAFYREHAVPEEFRWSWRNARLEQDVYRATIRASDGAFQRRTNYLGVLVLNHLASAVDALISSRMSQRRVVPRVGFLPGPAGPVVTCTITR